MKKGYLTVIIIGLIAAVAIFTNPNLATHKEAVKTKINTYMQKTIKEHTKDGESGFAGQAFGMLLGGALIDRVVDNMVSTDNYILFSTTKITWEGQSRVIGVGAFGNVYIDNKVNEAMTKATAGEQ